MNSINIMYLLGAAILTGFGTRSGQQLFDWLFPHAKHRITIIADSPRHLEVVWWSCTFFGWGMLFLSEIIDPRMTSKAPALGIIYGATLISLTVAAVAGFRLHRIKKFAGKK